jgi:glycosyltransferase involved in cell wall biosynthesis
MARGDVDVYHGAHFATPVLSRVPTVATVHDLTFYRLPRRYGLRHRHYYRLLAKTATRADRIIVPSVAVRDDVRRYLGVPGERIRVIAEAPRKGLSAAPAVEVEATCKRLGIAGPYFVILGTAEPGKRAVDAIRALSLLTTNGIQATLVLAGNRGPLSAALEAEAKNLGVQAHVRFVGYVADDELAPLLTGATALLFPSLYEGFGLPPLEAMACGTPVVASSAPAMTEVLGDAARFVPLRNPLALAAEARQMLESGGIREEYSKRGLERAGLFSWERTAEETAETYREAAGW